MQEPLQKSIRKHYWLLLSNLARKLDGENVRLFLARILYRLQIEGGSFIPANGGCLVVFNHVSDTADAMAYSVIQHYRPDVFLFAWELNRDLISDLLRTIGLPGSGERLITTNMRRPENVSGLIRSRQVLLEGGCVAMAPEGETTWDGRLQSPLAPGAAWLALHTAVPIIPIVSIGGYDVQPLWHRERIRLTGKIRIRAGKPVVLCERPLAKVTEAQVQAASQHLWQVLFDLISE